MSDREVRADGTGAAEMDAGSTDARRYIELDPVEDAGTVDVTGRYYDDERPLVECAVRGDGRGDTKIYLDPEDAEDLSRRLQNAAQFAKEGPADG